MIVVTGAAGFIASALCSHLNALGFKDLVLVDDFSRSDKLGNIEQKKYITKVNRTIFGDWLDQHHMDVDLVYHLGARTDTAEMNVLVFDELNLLYSKAVWRRCYRYQIPLIYASSAATYGDGALGFKEDHDLVNAFKPLNPYGDSKNDFDKWVLQQKETPPYWYGLKFFNVYGPNEYHKGRMASVIFHTYNQIKKRGKMSLFKSHKAAFADGEQQRDFVYVKDVVAMCAHLMDGRAEHGLYNIGTGKARTFYDLAASTFRAMGLDPDIDFIDTPEDIRDKYQYFTQADMTKMLASNYPGTQYTLESGIEEYVQEYLSKGRYY